MTFAEVKELERLRVQDATSKRLKEFDEKQQQIDRTISRRSGGWHEARTNLAFERIAAGIEDCLAIRKAMIERCPALATPYEILQFEKSASSVIETQFQAVLRSFPIMGVRPPASVLSQMPALKLALQHKIHVAARMMQLELERDSPHASISQSQPIPSQEKREDVLTLKPTIWGMSVNLNEMWRRMRPWFSKKA